jgi:hypothetical protein
MKIVAVTEELFTKTSPSMADRIIKVFTMEEASSWKFEMFLVVIQAISLQAVLTMLKLIARKIPDSGFRSIGRRCECCDVESNFNFIL